MPPPTTFADVLARRLGSDPGRPLITAYDDATGERTELSTTTYANWVSKTANLLLDELDLEPGDTVLLDLPVHWLVPVFLGAAWSAGLVVTTEESVEHQVVVCGPEQVRGLDELDRRTGVLACSLLPFAVRFGETLPAGVVDYGLTWPGQSDVFVSLDAPDASTPAWAAPDATQGELLARAGAAYPPGTRLLTDVHPATGQGLPAFLGPLATGGSLVLVAQPDETTWPARLRDERATGGLRATDQLPSL